MRPYQRLAEDDRMRRRTIADALEVLRDRAGFSDGDRATIHVGRLRLPSSQIVEHTQVLFDTADGAKAYIVSLPASEQFKAICPERSKRICLGADRLNGAVADSSGEVMLPDRTSLRAVEIIPAWLPYNPSELDWRIVHHTISIIGAEAQCYRHLRHGLPLPHCDIILDIKAIDCGTLTGLDLPPLKAIASEIAARDWTLKKLSQHQIADTLRKFGIRIPTSRPRVDCAMLSP